MKTEQRPGMGLRRLLFSRKMLWLMVSTAMLIGLLVAAGTAWFIRMSAGSNLHFDTTSWDFMSSDAVDDYVLNLYNYQGADHHIISPGMGGEIPLKIENKGSNGASYTVQLLKTKMCDEIRQRVRFFFYTEADETEKAAYADNRLYLRVSATQDGKTIYRYLGTPKYSSTQNRYYSIRETKDSAGNNLTYANPDDVTMDSFVEAGMVAEDSTTGWTLESTAYKRVDMGEDWGNGNEFLRGTVNPGATENVSVYWEWCYQLEKANYLFDPEEGTALTKKAGADPEVYEYRYVPLCMGATECVISFVNDSDHTVRVKMGSDGEETVAGRWKLLSGQLSVTGRAVLCVDYNEAGIRLNNEMDMAIAQNPLVYRDHMIAMIGTEGTEQEITMMLDRELAGVQ